MGQSLSRCVIIPVPGHAHTAAVRYGFDNLGIRKLRRTEHANLACDDRARLQMSDRTCLLTEIRMLRMCIVMRCSAYY